MTDSLFFPVKRNHRRFTAKLPPLEACAEFIKTEIEKWGKIVRELGLKASQLFTFLTFSDVTNGERIMKKIKPTMRIVNKKQVKDTPGAIKGQTVRPLCGSQ